MGIQEFTTVNYQFNMSKKIFYVNCTASAPHVGCLAVTDFHVKELLSEGYDILDIEYCDCGWGKYWKGDCDSSIQEVHKSDIAKRIKAVDVLVINGEGTLHHSPGAGLLALAATAKELGKKVFLINTSVFNLGEADKFLSCIDRINVREKKSSDYLKERGVDHDIVMDSFLGADFSDIPTQNYNGKTVIMDWHPVRDSDVGRATLSYISSLEIGSSKWLPLNHYCHLEDWRHIVANLRSAGMIVTGRYHGVYLAGLAGVPFVALPSNTKKIQGLLESSGLPIKIGDVGDVNRSIRDAAENPSLYKDFSKFLYDQLPLKTFNELVRTCPVPNDQSDGQIDKKVAKVEAMIAIYRRDSQLRNQLTIGRNRVNFSVANYIKRKVQKSLKSIKDNVLSNS